MSLQDRLKTQYTTGSPEPKEKDIQNLLLQIHYCQKEVKKIKR